MKDNIYIVVPSYDPDEKIMDKFLKELKKEFNNILIVNDGSNSSHDDYFKKLKKNGFEVINNYKNMGKGRAIKYSFNYLLNEVPSIAGCITCDCDGQHTIKDIKNIYNYLKKETDELILGVRNFDDKSVPLRSKFGNVLTRSIFKNLIGQKITDTQTGLRGFSKKLMIDFIDLAGERYEYETNMLIEAKKKNIKIKEIVIDTVYINDNKTSHFNPIKDSIKIYKSFNKQLVGNLLSFIVSILVFMLFINLINKNIILDTFVAGILGFIIKFIFNRKSLYKNRSIEFYIEYIILYIIKLAISANILILITSTNYLLFKILIDILLAIVFYYINYKVIEEL